MIGSKLAGRYEILLELGRGGMGAVYLAHDPVLDRDVAIKVMPPDRMSKDAEERFQREARIIAKMDHSAIVSVYDFNHHDDRLFFVMPLVHGPNLRTLLQESALTLKDIIEIAIQVADALEYSHTLGVIHRDIKPENIMVARDPNDSVRVKVMDFGVAIASTENRLTESGSLMGTLPYLSPEQASGQDIDGRSDIYSLGAVMYECFTSKPPFTGDWQSILYNILYKQPEPLRARSAIVDEELERIILYCLAKSPKDRPQRARQVSEAFLRYRMKLTAEGETRTVANQPTLKPLPLSAEPTFIGREKELAELQKRLHTVLTGECQLVVIGGQTGMGKRRLLSEFERLAEMRKIRVLHGRFVERQDRAFPYQGFCEVIQDYFRNRKHAIASELPDFSDLSHDLVCLFPMLTEITGLRPASLESCDITVRKAENKTFIFELLAKTLARIGDGKPLVLILKEMHGAEISIEALQYIFRRLGPTPTLIIGSYRTSEVDRHHPLLKMLRNFHEDPRFASLTLGPFSQPEHQRLLESVLGTAKINDELSKHIYEATEGNPLFMMEFVRALRESNHISKDAAGYWTLARGQILDAVLPVTIHQVIERRMDGLPEEHRDILSIASILGKTFEFDDLDLLCEDFASLDDMVDGLVQAGFLEEDRESRGRRLSFASGVMREVLYSGLSYRKRRSLHRKYAQLLEKNYAGRLDRIYHKLMHHFSLGDVAEKAVEYGLKVASKSLEAFSPEEVIKAAKTALEFLEDESWKVDRALEGEARTLLAEAYRMQGNLEHAIKETQKAITIFQQEGILTHTVAALFMAAEIAWTDRRIDETRYWVERGLQLAREVGDSERLAKFLNLGEKVASYRGEYDKANQYRNEAEGLGQGNQLKVAFLTNQQNNKSVDKMGEVLLLHGEYLAAEDAYLTAQEELRFKSEHLSAVDEAKYLLKLAKLAQKLGQYDEALERCLRGIEIVKNEDTLLSASLEALAGLICCSAGLYENAQLWINRGLARIKSPELVNHPEPAAVEAALHRTQGNLLIGLGRPLEAVAAYQKALAICEKLKDRWEYSIALFNVGDAYAHAGDYKNAVRYLDEAFADSSAIGDRWGLAYAYHARARICLEQGNTDRAMGEASAGLNLAIEIGDPKVMSMLRLVMGHTRLALDDIEGAEKDFHLAMRDASRAQAIPEIICAHLGIATVNRRQGRFPPALEAAKSGHELAKQSNSEETLAATLLTLGEVYSANADYKEAEKWYEAALVAVNRLGNPYRRFEVLSSIAWMNLLQGKYQDAIPHFQTILQDTSEGDDLHHRGLAFLGLAEVYFRCSENEKASAAAQAALKEFEALEAPRLIVAVQELLARFSK
ncbi:MAG: protein kinase [Acidobacteriota bacterium]